MNLRTAKKIRYSDLEPRVLNSLVQQLLYLAALRLCNILLNGAVAIANKKLKKVVKFYRGDASFKSFRCDISFGQAKPYSRV